MRYHLLIPIFFAVVCTLLLGREPLKPFIENCPMPLTLGCAIETALRQNPLILRAKAEVERTKGQLIEVRAQALPQIGISAIYQQQDRSLVQGGGLLGVGQRVATPPTPTPIATPTPTPSPGVVPTPTPRPTPTPHLFVQDKTWEVSVQVNQLIYSGGQVESSIRIARLTKDASYFRLRDTINTVIAAVRTQFYQLLVDRELIRVQEENVALLSSQWQDQQQRFAAGTVPRFNVLQAQVALANAIPSLIQAKNNYRLAEVELARTLGYDTDCVTGSRELFCAVGELSLLEPTMDLACALQTARERNPYLKYQRQNVLIGTEEIALQKGGYYPTLSANAGYLEQNKRLSSNLADAIGGWYFSIQGNWNIWDGGATYGRVKQARARLEQAKDDYNDSVLQVEQQVQQAWSDLMSARETVIASEATVEQAGEAVRLSRERLGAGSGTQLDVLNAAVQLTQARNTALQARNSYNAALAELDRVTSSCALFDECLHEPANIKWVNKVSGIKSKNQQTLSATPASPAKSVTPDFMKPRPIKTPSPCR